MAHTRSRSDWRRDTTPASHELEYEVWTRIDARGLAQSHVDDVRALLARVAFVELRVRGSAHGSFSALSHT